MSYRTYIHIYIYIHIYTHHIYIYISYHISLSLYIYIYIYITFRPGSSLFGGKGRMWKAAGQGRHGASDSDVSMGASWNMVATSKGLSMHADCEGG